MKINLKKLYRRYYFVTLRITFKLCRFPHRICQYEIKFRHEMTMFQLWYKVPLGRLEKLPEKMNQSAQSCCAALCRILGVTLEWTHWRPDKTWRNPISYFKATFICVYWKFQGKVLPLCVTKKGGRCWNINCKALTLGLSKQWRWGWQGTIS